MAVVGSLYLSDEETLEQRTQRQIPDHLAASRRSLTWQGVNGVPLVGEAFGDRQAPRAVLLVSGRVESIIKYDELTDELLRNGYAVYRYDHRGQGLSGRLLADPQPGHIDSYDHYVADLRQVITSIGHHGDHRHLLVIAHSMGACITSLLLAEPSPPPLSGAVLCSPMLRLKSGSLPHWSAWLLVNLWHLVRGWWPFPAVSSPYFRRGGPYQARPFADNHITHSAIRYRLFRQAMAAHPRAQIGDPTLAWVARSFRAAARAVRGAGRIKLPLLLLEAGADGLIDPRALSRFGQLAPHCQSRTINGARHELLFESDDMRHQALLAIYRFFDQCCSGET